MSLVTTPMIASMLVPGMLIAACIALGFLLFIYVRTLKQLDTIRDAQAAQAKAHKQQIHAVMEQAQRDQASSDALRLDVQHTTAKLEGTTNHLDELDAHISSLRRELAHGQNVLRGQVGRMALQLDDTHAAQAAVRRDLAGADAAESSKRAWKKRIDRTATAASEHVERLRRSLDAMETRLSTSLDALSSRLNNIESDSPRKPTSTTRPAALRTHRLPAVDAPYKREAYVRKTVQPSRSIAHDPATDSQMLHASPTNSTADVWAHSTEAKSDTRWASLMASHAAPTPETDDEDDMPSGWVFLGLFLVVAAGLYKLMF